MWLATSFGLFLKPNWWPHYMKLENQAKHCTNWCILENIKHTEHTKSLNGMKVSDSILKWF
jgi:hypothetical protein